MRKASRNANIDRDLTPVLSQGTGAEQEAKGPSPIINFQFITKNTV